VLVESLVGCLIVSGSSPNISWIVPPRSSSVDTVYDDYNFDDDDDGTWTSAETEDHSGALSCIGVRRLCLRDTSCRRLLQAFRQYCVENTKIHQCITSHWLVWMSLDLIVIN